jgi:hemerythrin-like domain-containing protein
MANVHNMIIRGLNSILRQAPYIADASSPAFNPQDVSDLLFYTKAWCKTLNQHHDTEESIFFPLVEKVTGVTGLMDDLEVEHEEFHDGLIALKNYVEEVLQKPDCYRWATMRAMIHAFSTALVNHLHGEIYFLLQLEKFGNEGLKKAWLETEKVATKVEDTTTLTEMFPLVLGCSDSTYEGGNNFPEVPKPLRRVIKHGFSKKHRGAWRFNPCDFLGRPQPLQMLPENRV